MKPVMISVPWKSALDQRARCSAATPPLHGRSERAPFHDDHTARIHPQRLAGTPGARLKVLVEQPRRPDLAIACDEVADIVGGRAGQLHGVQDALDVVAVPIHGRQVQRGVLRRQQRLGNGGVALAQRLHLALVALILLLGEHHQAQQRIGDAAAGGQHHPQAPLRLLPPVCRPRARSRLRPRRWSRRTCGPPSARFAGNGDRGRGGRNVVLELI